MILFTAGSALCGLAWSVNSLIIYKTFSEEERGLAMGIMGLPLLAAPAVGPVLGGYLVEHADWRLIFLINIPVGILAVLLSLLVLREFEKQRSELDFLGFILSAGGLAGLLLALSRISQIKM